MRGSKERHPLHNQFSIREFSADSERKKYFKNQVTHKKVGTWELYVKNKGLVFKFFETLNTKEKMP